MKTPNQLILSLPAYSNREEAISWVRSIQDDAYKSGLLRAAEVCRNFPIGEGGPADCAKAIEEEANK